MYRTISAACAAAALAAALPGRALEVQVSFGEDGSNARIQVRHVPAQEPLGALRIKLRLKPAAGAGALFLSRPDQGPWSQLTPELRRDGAVAEILALAPSVGESRGTEPVTIAELGMALSGTGLAAASDLVDSVWVEEALLPWGGKSTAGNPRLTTSVGKAARFQVAPAERIQGDRRTLTFALAKAGRVQVRVLDARGRTAVKVFDGMKPKGMNEVEWDGMGRGGKPLPAGTWFLRLEAGTFAYDRKLEVRP